MWHQIVTFTTCQIGRIYQRVVVWIVRAQTVLSERIECRVFDLPCLDASPWGGGHGFGEECEVYV